MERNYEQVSTEEILERSGVSRGALYHHFPTKLDLFRAVYMASERRVIDRIAAQASAARVHSRRFWPSPGGICARPRRTRSCAASDWARAAPCSAGRDGARPAPSSGIGVALAGVTAAIEAGELPPHDPETMAIVLLGAMIDAAMLIVVAEDRAAARERSEAVIVDLLEGLRR